MLSTDHRRSELVKSFYNRSRTREKRIPCKTQPEISILPSYWIPGVEGGALVKVDRFGIPGISGKSEQSGIRQIVAKPAGGRRTQLRQPALTRLSVPIVSSLLLFPFDSLKVDWGNMQLPQVCHVMNSTCRMPV